MGRPTLAKVLTLQSIEAPVSGRVIADLYEPVLLGFSPLAFRPSGKWGQVWSGSHFLSHSLRRAVHDLFVIS